MHYIVGISSKGYLILDFEDNIIISILGTVDGKEHNHIERNSNYTSVNNLKIIGIHTYVMFFLEIHIYYLEISMFQ